MLNHPAGQWGSAGIYTPESQNQGTTNHRITKSRNQKMVWEGRALDPILLPPFQGQEPFSLSQAAPREPCKGKRCWGAEGTKGPRISPWKLCPCTQKKGIFLLLSQRPPCSEVTVPSVTLMSGFFLPLPSQRGVLCLQLLGEVCGLRIHLSVCPCPGSVWIQSWSAGDAHTAGGAP